MDKFIRQVCEAFLQGIEDIVGTLCEGMSFPKAEITIKERCDELAATLCAGLLEEMDRQVREDREARKEWVVSRVDERSILGVMGEIRYSRTYYRNKETGEHRHLSDGMCGITPHMRVTPMFRANLVGKSCEIPYGKAGKQTGRCAVSGQTVMNSLRKLEFGPAREKGAASEGKKRRVSKLYIEADEGHISGNRNRRKRIEPKLVYVHEGRRKVGSGRGALINPKYFGGVYNDPDELWWEVHHYIEENYDVSALEVVFVTGDGASWITLGIEFVEKGVRLPDLFHLREYVVAASHGDKGLASKLWKAVDTADRAKTEILLDTAESTAVTKGQMKLVARCRTYLGNMWGAIENRRKYLQETVGCSAEGHVSHVYAERMSSRPASWSKTGADTMARLRVMVANGESVRDYALASAVSSFEDIQIDKTRAQQLRSGVTSKVRTAEGYLRAQLGNLPVLKGKTSFTARALRGLRDRLAV